MITRRHLIAHTAAALALIAAAASAHAQTTIDQNKAFAGSVTPGDAPGFPITLSVPGSYKLTGNLAVPAKMIGIDITAPNVTLDLNGFSINGPTTCTYASAQVHCNSAYDNLATPGIVAVDGATLRNGSVTGFSSSGVVLKGQGHLVENMAIGSNAGAGVMRFETGVATTTLRNLRVFTNGGYGIYAINTFITGSTIDSNRLHGVFGAGTGGVFVVDTSVANNYYGVIGVALHGVRLFNNTNGNTIGTVFSAGQNMSDFTTF
ncbi:right-handed parallel beta-helix repeat-containing protein [Roseateles sp.]|uniref:right-handed parallel beta-helix repeat-containing protein n=1 Tax=Roseateles sp. TaxID=1971397 RepID=UPI0032665A06